MIRVAANSHQRENAICLIFTIQTKLLASTRDIMKLIIFLTFLISGFASEKGFEELYYIAEAPQSLREAWKSAPEYFTLKEHVRPHDGRAFSKWRQLKKFWSVDKNEAHYERKESIVLTSENSELKTLNSCREDLKKFSINFLKDIERHFNLPEHSLTMESAKNPTHTLRLLHYLPNATAIAHCDTSILTCLYYQDAGLQLKINGKWINAPKLKPNEMLVTYGVPGEILSDGHLKAVRHRVKCDERYAVAYFHNTSKEFNFPENKYYNATTMRQVYQEAQLWYADVNARVVRKLCQSTELPWYVVLYGWAAQRWTPVNEDPVARKSLVQNSQIAVVFDYGNVLAVRNQEILNQFLCISLQMTKEEFTKAKIEKKSSKKPDEVFWMEFSQKSGKKLPLNWNKLYKEALRSSLGASEDMYSMIQELKELGIKVGLLSNIEKRYATIAKDFGLFTPFDPCLLTCDMGVKKPNPIAYELLQKAVGAEAGNIIFIDDDHANIETAQKMGFDAIEFKSSDQIRHELKRRGIFGKPN